MQPARAISSMLKPALVRLALSVAAILLFSERSPRAQVFNEVPEQRARIDGLITTLEKETWEESIQSLLTDGNQFYANGPIFKSTASDSQTQLEQMLSARRAIKVLNSLQGLPMDARVQRCRELFDRVLREQEDVWDEAMLKKERPDAVIPSLSAPRLNARHALCLAMFATAETGRRDVLGEQFGRLDEFQTKLRNRMKQHETLYDDYQLRTYGEICVPDRRFQLNVIRLVAGRDLGGPKDLPSQFSVVRLAVPVDSAADLPARIDTYCRAADMISMPVSIVPWNARRTAFERLVQLGGGPDTSNGVTNYVFYHWSHDRRLGSAATQEDVVRVARDLAFGSGVR
jgi:hypothetical protein